MKNISILGSTGSVGKNTVQVIRNMPGSFRVIALAAHSNIDLLEEQAREFHPKIVAVYDEKQARILQKRIPHIQVAANMEGVIEAACHADVEFVMAAISGTMGIIPTVHAIEAKKQIGLVNKEVIVSAGEYVMDLVRKNNVLLIPVDSEHSALFQCLHNENAKEVRKMILTASGGPFRNTPLIEMKHITLEDALLHPTYSMGLKNTIDSSTLMNKGLEVIEAKYLFNMDIEKIDVVIHPQSAVHSMVEYEDGATFAQISEPDMKLPIQYALCYPHRKKAVSSEVFFDFSSPRTLEFFPPDMKKFPCLQLAYEAARMGKSMPCFMNAANEVLVKRFLQKEIPWTGIAKRLEKLMSSHTLQNMVNLDSVLQIDAKGRAEAKRI